MPVDLYTDASIVRGRGAWAALVVQPGAPAETSGPLRGHFRSSAATEIAAIANGLHWARKSGLIAAGDEVRVWCDNTAAILWANGEARRLNSAGSNKSDGKLLECRQFIRDLAKRMRLNLRCHHVKGHQRLDSDDPGAIYNNRCDQLCSAVRDGVTVPPFAALASKVALAQDRRARKERDEGTSACP